MKLSDKQINILLTIYGIILFATVIGCFWEFYYIYVVEHTKFETIEVIKFLVDKIKIH